jgi:hypothetical protein
MVHFAFSHNPIYVDFAAVLIGEFFVFPNWILRVYLAAGVLLFHRQALWDTTARFFTWTIPDESTSCPAGAHAVKNAA